MRSRPATGTASMSCIALEVTELVSLALSSSRQWDMVGSHALGGRRRCSELSHEERGQLVHCARRQKSSRALALPSPIVLGLLIAVLP